MGRGNHKESEVKTLVFLGSDFGLKYVIADIEGEEFTISFRESFLKGIYDVSIRYGKRGPDGKLIPVPCEIKSTYPGFWRKIQEAVLLIRFNLEQAIKHRTNRNR